MIGQRIRQLRTERHLSLSELAGRAKVAKSYLSAIERDIQVNPSIQIVERIAAVLDVSVHALLPAEGVLADNEEIDSSWMDLAREAMRSGVSKQEFMQFLQYQRWRLRRKR